MACVSRNIRTAVPAVYGIPVQRSISERDCSHPVVELAIAEMACVSRNIRTAVPAVYGIPVQRSISERDCSHPVVEFGLVAFAFLSDNYPHVLIGRLR